MNEQVKIYGLGAVAVVAALVIAFQFVAPAPPKTFRIATGSPTGAYHQFGQKYADLIAKDGIKLELHPSAGSIANLGLLGDPNSGVSAAFVQGGTGENHPEGLVSLGSLYYEPLWVFYRTGLKVSRLNDFAGKRVAIGPEGSGTRAVSLRLLAESGVTPETMTALPMDGVSGHAGVLAGEVDVVMTVGGTRAKAVVEMLNDPKMALMSMDRAEAYVLRNTYLAALHMPQGAIDLARNIPDRDVTLLAPTATLVVREDLHPALATLLLRTAMKVHHDGGLFEKVGQFPSPLNVELPLSEEADRVYKSGPPLLQRYLPFWAADLVDRLKVMLLPLLTVLLPLSKIVPETYRWRIRRRIDGCYKRLLGIELSMRTSDAAGRSKLIEKLDTIEQEVTTMSVPINYTDALYTLRMHVGVVRETMARTALLEG